MARGKKALRSKKHFDDENAKEKRRKCNLWLIALGPSKNYFWDLLLCPLGLSNLIGDSNNNTEEVRKIRREENNLSECGTKKSETVLLSQK